LVNHIGTVAFGALIIAIIEFVRFVVTYLQRKSKQQNNKLQEAIFCCVQCCLKCVQCCMDKISKNAFIFTAVYGDAFCPSAAESFALVWRNLARVAAISMVGTFVVFVGKVMVAFASLAVAGYLMTKTSLGDNLTSPLLPGAFVFFLAYLIASLFMIIYETTIDTIFICFLIDEENNKNGVMLASKDLQKIIDAHAEESKKKAEEIKDSAKAHNQHQNIPGGGSPAPRQ